MGIAQKIYLETLIENKTGMSVEIKSLTGEALRLFNELHPRGKEGTRIGGQFVKAGSGMVAGAVESAVRVSPKVKKIKAKDVVDKIEKIEEHFLDPALTKLDKIVSQMKELTPPQKLALREIIKDATHIPPKGGVRFQVEAAGHTWFIGKSANLSKRLARLSPKDREKFLNSLVSDAVKRGDSKGTIEAILNIHSHTMIERTGEAFGFHIEPIDNITSFPALLEKRLTVNYEGLNAHIKNMIYVKDPNGMTKDLINRFGHVKRGGSTNLRIRTPFDKEDWGGIYRPLDRTMEVTSCQDPYLFISTIWHEYTHSLNHTNPDMFIRHYKSWVKASKALEGTTFKIRSSGMGKEEMIFSIQAVKIEEKFIKNALNKNIKLLKEDQWRAYSVWEEDYESNLIRSEGAKFTIEPIKPKTWNEVRKSFPKRYDENGNLTIVTDVDAGSEAIELLFNHPNSIRVRNLTDIFRDIREETKSLGGRSTIRIYDKKGGRIPPTIDAWYRYTNLDEWIAEGAMGAKKI
jgi:hypothetical protein